MAECIESWIHMGHW